MTREEIEAKAHALAEPLGLSTKVTPYYPLVKNAAYDAWTGNTGEEVELEEVELEEVELEEVELEESTVADGFTVELSGDVAGELLVMTLPIPADRMQYADDMLQTVIDSAKRAIAEHTKGSVT